MHSRPITNIFLTASLALVQPSNCHPADHQRQKRRIGPSSHNYADAAGENDHQVFRHNFLGHQEAGNYAPAPLPSARIVGGTETQPNRHPYMVSLQKVVTRQAVGGTTLVFFAQKCGGTLIADGEYSKEWEIRTHIWRKAYISLLCVPAHTCNFLNHKHLSHHLSHIFIIMQTSS